MRVAVVDIGSNSTRLLIADVAQSGAITELERDSTVTRLGQDVDRTGALAPEAMQRVYAVLERYRERIDATRATATTAVLTSAVRDATNGADFTATVTDRYGLEAATLSGDEEARLTFLGATSERPDDGTEVVVIDIGGGSTELVAGTGRTVDFRASTQAGVVRHSERHVHHDPPRPEELQALREEVEQLFAAAVPQELRTRVKHAVAVAGTATSLAAIAQELDPYDPDRVHGFRLLDAQAAEMLARLAQMPEADRRCVTGLQPDRAPTIVAGVVLLRTAMWIFGLDEVEVSEHDILRGAALARAGLA